MHFSKAKYCSAQGLMTEFDPQQMMDRNQYIKCSLIKHKKHFPAEKWAHSSQPRNGEFPPF